MKKLMTLMLGLSLVLGSTALFADESAATTKTRKVKKAVSKRSAPKKKARKL